MFFVSAAIYSHSFGGGDPGDFPSPGQFLSSIYASYPFACWAAAAFAVICIVLYLMPRVEHGPEYEVPGKVKELGHVPSRSWTSGGWAFNGNGGGYVTQSHSTAEEFHVVLETQKKKGWKEVRYLDNKELYETVEEGQQVQLVFSDRTLIYFNGSRASDGRDLAAVVVDDERIEL